MTSNSEQRPWSLPVPLHEIPEQGRRFEIAADAEARSRIAAVAGLRSLPRLEAVFDVRRHGAGGVRVSGQVSARVGQTCVVTLEPIESEVEEGVDLVFVPGNIDADPEPDADLPVNDDAPEALVGDSVDLGAVATEFVLLGIDPYPRKPDAVFDSPAPVSEPEEHPFAALAALKKGPGPGQS
jgi:uncharacterized metal-binding protein YceD (DUF177 family)